MAYISKLPHALFVSVHTWHLAGKDVTHVEPSHLLLSHSIIIMKTSKQISMNLLLVIQILLILVTNSLTKYNSNRYSNQWKMAHTPYTLRNGDYYRDMLTIENSRWVADMARKFQYDLEYTALKNKEKLQLISWARSPPKFFTNYSYKKGDLKDDDEIFDFTDSRLIVPPDNNQYKFPLVDIYMRNSDKLKNQRPLVQISYSYDPKYVRLKEVDYSQRKPKHYYMEENNCSPHTSAIRPNIHHGRHNYSPKNNHYRNTRSNVVVNDNIGDYLKQYDDDLLSLKKPSAYPYHIFDISKTVRRYSYPYDESKYIFSHPNF